MTPAEILTLHHLRKTPTRQAILQSLLASSLPLSEAEMRTTMPGIHDRITFYRTIQSLMEAGIIHRIVADNTTVRYALNHCSAHHHEHGSDHVHFFCTRCERVECLQGMRLPSYDLPADYVQTSCEVIIKGLCKTCASK